MAPPNRVPYSRAALIKEADEPIILANRYRIIRKLGSGSFGTVFLVADIKNNDDLKVLKEIPIGDARPDETISAVNEARLLAKLEHPGIVRFHDSFIDGQFFCIITEYCEGGDLDDKLHAWKKNNKDVDHNLVMTWFIQIVLAVQYMHQRRVLHRDLKTRNIFLKNNMVKIGDFGISRILMGTTDIATTFTGTPYFMAPEILKHEGYNSKSDIWSIGVILYEMCSLNKAFQGNNLMSIMFKIVEGDIPRLPKQFNNKLYEIYERMLCKDPTSRISAADILKQPIIKEHLEKLKGEVTNNFTFDQSLARKDAAEIARVLKKSRRKKVVSNDSTRPKTPKEMLKLRKQKKADEEAERLKKVTVSSYIESRTNYSRLKQRQSQVAISSIFTDTTGHEQKNTTDGYKDVVSNVSKQQCEQFSVDSSLDTVDLDDRREIKNENYINPHNNARNKIVVNNARNELGIKNTRNVLDTENVRKYTNCFGEDEEVTLSVSAENGAQMNEPRDYRAYTHCFGEDSDEEKNQFGDNQGEDVFEEEFSNNDAFDFTDVRTIPEDETLADTYYTTCEDFEEDVSSGSGEELDGINEDYGALVHCMENALDLSQDDNDTTFGDSLYNTTSMRQQKIDSLRRECIRLLGEEGFHRAYKYLNKVRFESRSPVSEDHIMGKLRKMVGSSRDCFLVDQLLFLEKQNQISLA